MADLTPSARDGRGQLLLVTALGLAALLVVLTVVLNSAVHTDVAATGQAGVDESGALAYRSDAGHAVASTIVYTNAHNDTSYKALRENLTARLADWSDRAGSLAAADGGDRNVTLIGFVKGTRVEQTNAARDFTNASGNDTWTLVPGTTSTTYSRVRDFHLTVTRNATVDASNSDGDPGSLKAAGAFAIAVSNSTGTRHVFVYRYKNATSDRVVVRVENDNGVLGPRCYAPTAPDATIDVSNATVGGTSCPTLDLLGGTSAKANVTFERSENVAGTYSLTVDQDYADVTTRDDFSTTDTSKPYATYALYNATVRIGYVTPRTTYTTTLHVVPEGSR